MTPRRSSRSTGRRSPRRARSGRDRLAKFINLRTFYPTRVEFNDYYAWAAQQFDKQVRWGTDVLEVTAVPPGEHDAELLRVVLRDQATGETDSVLTRNLLIAPGGTPYVPEGAGLGERVFHASETRERLERSFDDLSAPYHFNVVGSGQTSADVFMHLRRSYPNARITTNIRGFAMRPEDDTHFVTLHRFTELVGARSDAERAVATYFHLDSGETSEVDADAVILATGYRYPMPIPALAGLDQYLRMETPERYAIRRDYAIESVEGFGPRIFLQGFAEATHGFSEVLLSLMPMRAADIVQSIAENASVESR
ncbi:SidA/IucD/PvdA family monooxygenase [Streptomyces sp. T028]|uniref:SidA/IucD/PvdA family monooxygenase n=1 Tax=Streptomyces sp. T028 TaxID=3394379 RepID=UPI003A8A14FC